MLLHPAPAGPAEGNHLVRNLIPKVIICLGIQVRVCIPEFVPLRAIRRDDIPAPDKFAAVGLEAVNSDILQQIPAFLQKPFSSFLIREIHQQGISKPGAARQSVKAPVLVFQNIAPLNSVHLIPDRLGGCFRGIFQHGNLPQQALDSTGMKRLHHPLGIGPAPRKRKILVVEGFSAL